MFYFITQNGKGNYFKVQQNENYPNIRFGGNILILLCIVCSQTHLVFCAILVVGELIEEGLLPPVVPTNRVDVAFHLGEQLMSLKLQGNKTQYQCMILELRSTVLNSHTYTLVRHFKILLSKQ